MTARELDKIDLKLITMLQNNARMSVAEMAREIGKLTENAIRYRIGRLESEGYILEYTARLDPQMFGKNITAFFNLNVLPENIDSAVDYLKKIDYLTDVFITTGRYTITAIGFFEDRGEITRFITDNLKRIRMIDFDVITVLHKVKYEPFRI
ncbi:MAG: Lrp/AsnC family transcriptional regulator [Thermoplasmata archaeon]|nr:MAG: Lrp/AsnC family transcriptional regulator [Thermoplasmata archaeon]